MNIVLVGFGNMGSALAKGWQSRMTDISLYIIDPTKSEKYSALTSLPADIKPDAIVFAVKPQSMDAVLPEYAARFGAAPLYISIAAGKTLGYYATHLGASARIIRVMPNTPAQVGVGASALVANAQATSADKTLATQLFAAVGSAVWLESEMQMHAVTALSGSGPAYAFLFLDAVAKAGVSLGLPEKTARELAIQTLRGAAELAAASPESFEQLRRNVTSPGGTTEAALAVLMKEERFEETVKEAMKAAARRSEELK